MSEPVGLDGTSSTAGAGVLEAHGRAVGTWQAFGCRPSLPFVPGGVGFTGLLLLLMDGGERLHSLVCGTLCCRLEEL